MPDFYKLPVTMRSPGWQMWQLEHSRYDLPCTQLSPWLSAEQSIPEINKLLTTNKSPNDNYVTHRVRFTTEKRLAKPTYTHNVIFWSRQKVLHYVTFCDDSNGTNYEQHTANISICMCLVLVDITNITAVIIALFNCSVLYQNQLN